MKDPLYINTERVETPYHCMGHARFPIWQISISNHEELRTVLLDNKKHADRLSNGFKHAKILAHCIEDSEDASELIYHYLQNEFPITINGVNLDPDDYPEILQKIAKERE